MKYSLALILALLFSANTSAQTPYEQWRFSVNTYFPGQNFSSVGPTQRFNNGYVAFRGQQSFVQPTYGKPGGTITYINTPARPNQFGHHIYPLPPSNQKQIKYTSPSYKSKAK